MSPRPRPILKRDSSPFSNDLPFTSCGDTLSPHVHFPPTPWMISLRFTHSPNTYDRAPILVSPNACQLPKRGQRKLHSPPVDPEGERGRSRSRSRDGDCSVEEDVKGSYFHPRAYEACNPEPLHTPTATFRLHSPPSLVPDSSPSDESDDSVETPPDATASNPAATTTMPMLSNDISYTGHSYSTCASTHVDESVNDSPVFLSDAHASKAVKEKRRRPRLSRHSHNDAFELSRSFDEGCLGGF
ncbi:hypothetical protein AcV7_001015 [Taiwanofungus camphoratus]|nr:hypothetical protein AcV7_001015 [Antrodia cinnamomea]